MKLCMEININDCQVEKLSDGQLVVQESIMTPFSRLLGAEIRGKRGYIQTDEQEKKVMYLYDSDGRLIAVTNNGELLYLDIRQATRLEENTFWGFQKLTTLFLGKSIVNVEKGALNGTALECVYCAGIQQRDALEKSGYKGKIIIDPNFGKGEIRFEHHFGPNLPSTTFVSRAANPRVVARQPKAGTKHSSARHHFTIMTL